jgi:hypothetical protein
MKTSFVFNDGGAHIKDRGHCVSRSIAIVTGLPFIEVYTTIKACMRATRNARGKDFYDGYALAAGAKKTSPARGVPMPIVHQVLKELGFLWVPTMRIGQGCKVHMRSDELPPGRLIVRLSGHVTAVIDGVEHSTYDSSRNGTRCVYGYWYKPA